MSLDTKRFIELATRPLSDKPELQQKAAADLHERLEKHASAEQITLATESLERAQAQPRRRFWRIALYVITVLASLFVIFGFGKKIVIVYRGIKALGRLEALPAQSLATKTLTPAQRLLLDGDAETTNRAARWKPLWDSEPNNPMFLAQYAAACCAYDNENQLPAEILQTAAGIDPDNGWFLALAASDFAKNAEITSKHRSAEEIKAGKVPVLIFKDFLELKKALDLIHESAEKNRFTSYADALHKRRAPLLPKRSDWAGDFALMSAVFYSGGSADFPTTGVRIFALQKALHAGAQFCAAHRNIEGFHRIVGDWEKLCLNLTHNGHNLLDLLIAKTMYLGSATTYRDVAQDLGLEAETRRFSALAELQKADKAEREQRRKNSAKESPIYQKGSVLAKLSLPILTCFNKKMLSISEANLQPSRYADHALIYQIGALAIALLLFYAVGMARNLPWKKSITQEILLPRKIAVSLEDLLRPGDWLWLLAAPWIALGWFLLITRLTPLSAREWSVFSGTFLLTSLQLGSLALTMILAPVAVAGWRLNRCGSFLGLQSRKPSLSWVALFSAALALPVSGGMMTGGGNFCAYASATLLGLALTCLLIGFFRYVFIKRFWQRGAMFSRMLIPSFAMGMLLMVISVPFSHQEEIHWLAKDQLFKVSADAPTNQYEWEVTEQFRKELLEMMKIQ